MILTKLLLIKPINYYNGRCQIMLYEEYGRSANGTGTLTLSNGRQVNYSAATNKNFIVECTLEELNGSLTIKHSSGNYSLSTFFVRKNGSQIAISDMNDRWASQFTFKLNDITANDQIEIRVQLSSSI